jgi:hypothetical protein
VNIRCPIEEGADKILQEGAVCVTEPPEQALYTGKILRERSKRAGGVGKGA